MGGGLGNIARLSGNDTLQISLDYLKTAYDEADVARRDQNLSIRANLTHVLSSRLTLLADFTFIKNESTVPDTYSYNRFMTGMGLSWNL